MTQFTSKFPGICTVCKKPYNRGDRIEWDGKKESIRCFRHFTAKDERSYPVRTQPSQSQPSQVESEVEYLRKQNLIILGQNQSLIELLKTKGS